MLSSTKLFGYCVVIDHDDVFPDLQRKGKRLVFPLAHGCVIDLHLAEKVRSVLSEKFNIDI
jgi:hypothetical protein